MRNRRYEKKKRLEKEDMIKERLAWRNGWSERKTPVQRSHDRRKATSGQKTQKDGHRDHDLPVASQACGRRSIVVDITGVVR